MSALTQTEEQPTLAHPRTRWAAVVWGCFFLATALGALWIITDDGRRDTAGTWIGTLTPGPAFAYLGLFVGLLLLVGGVVGLIRRAQRAETATATATATDAGPATGM